MARAARIVVVNDDPAIRKIITDRLRSLDHDVQAASGGVEALKQVSGFRPDLMLLDLRMPDLGGFDVLEELQS